MKQTVFVLLYIFFIQAVCQAQQKPDNTNAEVKFPESGAYAKSNLTYKIIPAPNATFCYDIFADNKLMIHQPSKPGMPGNEGFKSQKSAEKVALLVIEKIRKGEMPPTVTQEELKKLDAVN